MSASSQRSWLVALGVFFALGTVVRLSNAFLYPIDMGFDAQGNWDYIAQLLSSWALPPPDSGWSTAHPPLFYYLSGAIGRLVGGGDKATAVHAIRIAMAASGLLGIGLAVSLIRRVDPGNGRRAFLAGALLLFLPVHIYMSAMLTEEVLVTALISLVVVGVAMDSLSSQSSARPMLRAALFGVVAGLALLTKLTGLLVVTVGAATYLIAGLRSESPSRDLGRAAAFSLAALLFGGWFYAWNLYSYGYLYPHGLEVHSVMFRMPPGDRSVVDYLSIPWQTFFEPNLLSPSLLHSVWGSTYDTIWYDGHRHFVPRSGSAVGYCATAILLLGLLPTAAFAVGLLRGLRRLFRELAGPDVVMLLLVVATLAGYVLFTWRNPWFAVLKGSFLLGLSVPFAYYASEVLADWTREHDWRGRGVFVGLGLLAILVTIVFSYGIVFEKHEFPGLPWTPIAVSGQG